jgi:hypothetical protein
MTQLTKDPRSEIREKPFLDSGVKKAPDPGSGSQKLQDNYQLLH